MFYSEIVLAKKGPLGKVWLAAHWSKKLTRVQITRSDVVECCNSIIKPTVPLALRTSGHLLLGVVRIHDIKQKSLMNDCSDALVKIKLAFRPGVVDMAPGDTTARIPAITLSENFTDFDVDMPPARSVSTGDYASQPTLNMGRLEDITLADPFPQDLDPEMLRMGDDFGQERLADIPFFDEPARDLDFEVNREGQNDFNGPMDITVDPSFDQIQPSPITRPKDFSFDDSRRELRDGGLEEGGLDALGYMEGIREQDDTFLRPDLPDEPLEALGALHEQDEPLEPLAPRTNAAAASKAKKKRKLIEDSETEIPGKIIRDGLQPDGPNNITRAPYRADYARLSFDYAPCTERALKRRLRDEEGSTVLLETPLMQGLAPGLLALFTRTLSSQPDVPLADFQEAEAARAVEEGAGPRAEDHQMGGLEMDQQMGGLELDQPPYLELDGPAPEFPQHDLDRDIEFPAGDMTNDPTGDIHPSRSLEAGLIEDDFLDVKEGAAEATREVTTEEWEQASWSKRTQKMMANLRTGFEAQEELSFNDMTHKKSRRTAAACLFELLVLKTKDFVQIQQDEPYGDIIVRPTDRLLVAE